VHIAMRGIDREGREIRLPREFVQPPESACPCLFPYWLARSFCPARYSGSHSLPAAVLPGPALWSGNPTPWCFARLFAMRSCFLPQCGALGRLTCGLWGGRVLTIPPRQRACSNPHPSGRTSFLELCCIPLKTIVLQVRTFLSELNLTAIEISSYEPSLS